MRLSNMRIVIAVTALLLLVAGCGSSGGGDTAVETGEPTTTTTGDTTITRNKVTVNIQNFSFTPQEVTVSKGGTITWVNKDSVPHTVTATNNEFASQQLNTGQSFTFTATTPGAISYFCSIHPNMTGSITVK